MTTRAYASTQAVACRPRRSPGPTDPLQACAAVAALLDQGQAALAEITAVLEDTTGGPVTVLPAGARPDLDSPELLALAIAGGAGGWLVLEPTAPAWRETDSAALTVLARVLGPVAPASGDGQVETTATTLLDGFEVEMRDIAERLHRGVLQSLVGSRYLFDLARGAEGAAAVEALGLAREAVQEALTEGRALLSHVTPRVRDRVSLQAEAALLPSMTVSSSGRAPLGTVVSAATYRLLQAVSRAGGADVRFEDVRGAVRVTISLLTERAGSADRGLSTTGAGPADSGLGPYVERLRLVGGRVVRDEGDLVLDLPAAPRLPVQRSYRSAGEQPRSTATGSFPSNRARRTTTQRTAGRSEGNS